MTLDRRRLGWATWAGLLLLVVVFGLVAVQLGLEVRALRAEVERNVHALGILQSLPAEPERARRALEPALDGLDGALARSGGVVLEALDGTDRQMAVGAFTRELRRENARRSQQLGAAWQRATQLLAVALVFAFAALLLGAVVMRVWDRQQRMVAELARQEARAETADVLRVLNQELTTARDDALRAQEMKTRLLSMLGHELRTPLSAIRGYAELLQEDGIEDAANILHATRRIERRVAQILDLSERDDDTTRVRRPCELTDIVGPLAERWGATVNGTAKAATHAGRLTRVLEEVLANANRFGEHVRVLLYIDNGSPVIEVTDDGPGMTAQERDRATEPFWQAEPRGDAVPDGLGLGLAVAEHHVRVLEGELEIDTKPGDGTTVRIRLP